MVWRLPLGLRLLLASLAIFTGGFALICFVSPLWAIFTTEEEPIWALLFFVFVSAPLFGWVTLGIFQSLKSRVVADENGLEITRPPQQDFSTRCVSQKFAWSEISALYFKATAQQEYLFLQANGEEISLPLSLSGPKTLREELENRTGLRFIKRDFAPTNAETVIEFDTLARFRAQKTVAAICWLIYAFLGGGIWVLVARYSPFYSPDMLLGVVVCAAALLGLLIYLATRTVLEIRLWRRFKNQRWRFDARGISCETRGETRFLALENIESLEKIGARILRARGGETILEWPKETIYTAREEEFLVEQLARAGREIAWREIPKNAALNSSP